MRDEFGNRRDGNFACGCFNLIGYWEMSCGYCVHGWYGGDVFVCFNEYY